MSRKKLIRELKKGGAQDKEAAELADLVANLKVPALLRSRSFKLRKLQELSAKPDRRFSFNWRRIFAPLTLGLASLTMTVGTVFASQDSVPGEPLYPLKRFSEKVFQTINPKFTEKFAVRRSEEIKKLVFKNSNEALVIKSVEEFKQTPPTPQMQPETQENLEQAENQATGNSKEEIRQLISSGNVQGESTEKGKSGSKRNDKQNQSTSSSNSR